MNVLNATERLEGALDAVPEVGAALVPLVAWAGTVIFGAFLAERLVRFVIDRKNKGPRRRDLMSRVAQLGNLKHDLVSLPYMTISRNHTLENAAKYFTAESEIEILELDLKALGIETPPFGIWERDDRSVWIEFLSRLEVYACKGKLDRAVALGCYFGNPSREGEAPDA